MPKPSLPFDRRQFLVAALAGIAGGFKTTHADLRAVVDVPLKIDAIRILTIRGKNYCLVTSGKHQGIVEANSRVPALLSVFKELVNPFFLGKDARDISILIDDVYRYGRNYKYAGMPFWNAVANVELAVLDMLGRFMKQPVSNLFGTPLRTDIEVYISRFNRDNSGANEVEQVTRSLEITGAKATKLKVGRRLSDTAKQTRRDREMIDIARERWGNNVTILVDANSSYTAEEAIDIGRHFQDNGVAFFEEPCLWQDYRSTKQVADELTMPIAGGEQDNSLYQFRELAVDRVVDIIQPDIYYNGGFQRLLRVAEIASAAGMECTPHTPRTGPAAAPLLQAVSLISNLGRFTEYREAPEVHDGRVTIPSAPGFGGASLVSQQDIASGRLVLESRLET